MIIPNGEVSESSGPDERLLSLVAQAHAWFSDLVTGKVASIEAIAKKENIDAGDVSRFLGLAFLAPDLVEAILDGRQPVELTAERLKRMTPLPLLWSEQRVALGFA